MRGIAGWLCVGVGLAGGSQVVATPGLEGVVVGLFPVLYFSFVGNNATWPCS